MFRACFVSSFRNFTWHFNFRYFACATYSRNLDSAGACILVMSCVGYVREPQAAFTRQTNVGQLVSANSKLVFVNDKATCWQTVGDK